MDKYYMAIDQNGQPYIEHAFFSKKKDHKYLMRITENGKPRYFYTQKEIDAYRNKQQRKQKRQERYNSREQTTLKRYLDPKSVRADYKAEYKEAKKEERAAQKRLNKAYKELAKSKTVAVTNKNKKKTKKNKNDIQPHAQKVTERELAEARLINAAKREGVAKMRLDKAKSNLYSSNTLFTDIKYLSDSTLNKLIRKVGDTPVRALYKEK